MTGVENQGNRNGTHQHATTAIASVAHDLGAQAKSMLFTWASRARVLDCHYGKETVRYEGSCCSRRAHARRALEDRDRPVPRAPVRCPKFDFSITY
ncbi:alpha/beta hydrolase [Sinorhizobium psoraleae]|uniref:alpha/beta hydrolase n=1 Tax=Sinorhizobium psoraleae TaxID=520838 RepID=UPI0035E3DCB8